MSIIQIIIYFNFMKKLIYLTILVLIVACGGNDSDDSNTSIVGNWQLTALLDNNGNPFHDVCDLESYMTVSTTNSGNYYQYYSDDLDTEPCGLDQIIDMTWSEVSSSTYNISFIGTGGEGVNLSFSAVVDGQTLTIDGDDDEVIVFTRN
jgi:hypothetical protein|tara:strand:+ start:129 stop:575 length:447 start_codon:yes stop_codon:yes gene_type:complete